jgi:hypothetical protein
MRVSRRRSFCEANWIPFVFVKQLMQLFVREYFLYTIVIGYDKKIFVIVRFDCECIRF